MLLVLVKLMVDCCNNSQGATVVITNANNDVVANTGLVAGTYTPPLPLVVMKVKTVLLLLK
jgi:hypothetical protein